MGKENVPPVWETTALCPLIRTVAPARREPGITWPLLPIFPLVFTYPACVCAKDAVMAHKQMMSSISFFMKYLG